eukprot:5544173-Prymnesium_polylepis.1
MPPPPPMPSPPPRAPSSPRGLRSRAASAPSPASVSAVLPLADCAVGEAPASSSARTHPASAERTASMSGVTPAGCVHAASADAPRSRSSATQSAAPADAAWCSAPCPLRSVYPMVAPSRSAPSSPTASLCAAASASLSAERGWRRSCRRARSGRRRCVRIGEAQVCVHRAPSIPRIGRTLGRLAQHLDQPHLEPQRGSAGNLRRLALAPVSERRRRNEHRSLTLLHARERKVPRRDHLPTANPHAQRLARFVPHGIEFRAVRPAKPAAVAHEAQVARRGHGARPVVVRELQRAPEGRVGSAFDVVVH